MKALDRSWPFVPEVHLFHDRDEAGKFMREEFGMMPKFLSLGAQAWRIEDTAIVLLEHSGTRITEEGCLVHEAYHVVYRHFSEYIGEEWPSEEFMAYGMQVVSKALFEAHERWKESDARHDA